jgi:hypothetical protein
MKKLILAIILVLCAGLCFAQEGESASAASDRSEAIQPASAPTSDKEKFNMEVSVGIAVHSTTSPTPHEFMGAVSTIDNGMVATTAVGFAMTFSLHKFVGFTLSTDFSYATEELSQSNPQSSSILLFGTNVFMGPVFYLWTHRLFRIPLALGAHMHYWDSTLWVPALNATDSPGAGWLRNNNLQVGVGSYVGIHFYFSQNAYMISRVNFDVDMYRFHRTRLSNGVDTIDEGETEMAIGWGIRPSIGLGMRF